MKAKSKPWALFCRSYREAGALLSDRGNRFVMIEAWVVVLLLIPLYLLSQNAFALIGTALVDAYGSVFGIVTEILYSLLSIALTVFLTIPLLVGVVSLGDCMERGEAPALSELFLPFSSHEEYKMALALSFGVFWRLWLIVKSCELLWYLTGLLPLLPAVAKLLGFVLITITVILGLFFCMCRFFSLFFSARGVLWQKDVRMPRRHGALFLIGFLPHLILGILTLGIWLLFDVLPRACIAYFRYCNYQTDELTQSEDEKYE